MRDITLTWDTSGGVPEYEPDTIVDVPEGESRQFKIRPPVTILGSEFKCWVINGIEYRPQDGQDSVYLDADATAKAVWNTKGNPNEVLLTYNLNGGTATPELISPFVGVKGEDGKALCKLYFGWTYSKEGFEFFGWEINGVEYPKTGEDGIYLEADATANAIWKREGETVEITLTYDMQGGTPPIDPETQVVMDGVPGVFLLPMTGFTKEGFSFLGWTVDGVEYPVSEKEVYAEIFEDSTAYANWQKQGETMEITLKYDSNGGTTKPNDDIKELPDGSESVEFTLAGPIERLDRPDGRGYTFDGWEVDGVIYPAGGTVEIPSTKTEETAVAQWKLQTTTVSPKIYGYSPNGTTKPLGKTRFHHQPNYPRPMGV